MREQLKEITKQFLQQFNDPQIENISIPEEIENKLISLACFIAQARTGVSRDRYHQTVMAIPEAEGPARLTKQLWTMGAGIAIVQGKKEIDDAVYKILTRIAINSLPRHRNSILKTMFESLIMSSVWEHTKAIGKLIATPTETVKRYLEDLWMLGLVARQVEGEDDDDDAWKTKRVPYGWQLSKSAIELIESSEIYLFNAENLPKDAEI